MMFPAFEVSLQVKPFGFWGLVWAMKNSILCMICMIYELAILAVAKINFTMIRHETHKEATNKKD